MHLSQADLRVTKDINTIDSYLTDKGFPKEDIDSIRLSNEIITKIFEAAKVFKTIGWNDFSVYDLGAVVNPKEIDVKMSPIFKALKELYSYDIDNSPLDINNMALLRIFTDNYTGNLLKANKAWPEFQPGRKDWKENINIPLSIDDDVARILGTIWVDGTGYNGVGVKVLLEGNLNDREFYSAYVSPQIKEIFNYDAHVHKTDVPTIGINSKAINTWVIDDLEFDIMSNGGKMSKKEKRIPPSIDFSDEKIRKGFLEGVIAGKTSISISDKRLIFSDSNGVMTDFLKDLLNSEKINYKNQKKGIYLNAGETRRVLHEYELLNPKHLNSKKELFGN